VLDAVGAATGYVFGSSSGAIVALDLLTRHPDRVTTVIAHEPPLVELVPDGPAVKTVFDEVYATWQREGGEAAMREFATKIFGEMPPAGRPRRPVPSCRSPIVDMMARIQANLGFWMEHGAPHVPPLPSRTPRRCARSRAS